MNPRTILVGFLGGILAASLLRYPFSNVFLTPYIAGWPAGEPRLAWVAVGAAILLIILAGAAAARVGGIEGHAGGACSGSAAGLVAGALVAASSGAAAAGVYGSRMLLIRPMEAAASEAEFLTLLSEAVLQTVFWTHVAAWLLIIGGTALGALGGAIAGGKSSRGGILWISYQVVWLNTAVAGLLVSTLAFIVTSVIYALLSSQTANASATVGHTLSLPAWTLTSVPLLTCMGFFLLFQLVAWIALRDRVPPGMMRPAWAHLTRSICSAMPFVLVIGLFFLARASFLQPLVSAGLVVMCLLGVLTFFAGRRLGESEPFLLPPTYASLFGWTAFLSVSALTLIALLTSAASLNTVSLIIPQIVLLSPESAGSANITFNSMRSLAEVNFTYYGAIYAGLLWAPFVAGALGIGLGWLVDRRRA